MYYIYVKNMTIRKYTQKEHDDVIMASLEYYKVYWEKGCIVSFNPGNKQCHDIGGGNFPDIVVWTPNTKNGINHIIEEIETQESINFKKSEEWKKFSNIATTFYLVVPRESYKKTEYILKTRDIGVTMLQYYYIDKDNKIIFSSNK